MIARDDAEREITVNEHWGAGRDTHYTYDSEGRIQSLSLDVNSNNPGSGRDIAYVYDELGQETQMTVSGDGAARTTESTYFASGDLATVRKSNGTLECYAWRADSEIAQRLRDPEGNPSQGCNTQAPDTDEQPYAYDENANRTRDEKGTHRFNARSQLVAWDPDKVGEGLVSYELNGAGQMRAKLDADSDDPDDADQTFRYTGDPDNGERLKHVTSRYPGQADIDAQRSFYRYDDLGNVVRIQILQEEPGGSFPSPADPADSPDPCANTGGWSDEEITYYCFDEFSRLFATKGADSEAKVELTLHDGLDRRDLRIGEGGEQDEFSYVGTSEALSRERKDNGAIATYDYDSSGRRQGQRRTPQSGTATYRAYAHDAQGSVIGLEDDQGQIPADRTYEYDPYGALQDPNPGNAIEAEEELATEAQQNPFRFQGFYYDSAVKSYDMLAREYRPETGRFLSQDRFADAGLDLALQSDPLTQNRYVFVGANPTSQVEFDGHVHCGDLSTVRECKRRQAREIRRDEVTPNEGVLADYLQDDGRIVIEPVAEQIAAQAGTDGHPEVASITWNEGFYQVQYTDSQVSPPGVSGDAKVLWTPKKTLDARPPSAEDLAGLERLLEHRHELQAIRRSRVAAGTAMTVRELKRVEALLKRIGVDRAVLEYLKPTGLHERALSQLDSQIAFKRYEQARRGSLLARLGRTARVLTGLDIAFNTKEYLDEGASPLEAVTRGASEGVASWFGAAGGAALCVGGGAGASFGCAVGGGEVGNRVVHWIGDQVFGPR